MSSVNKARNVLLVAPMFDPATYHSYTWSREIKAYMLFKGCNVVDISGRKVRRSEVESNLISINPDIVVFYDHGNEEQLFGSESDVVIDKNNVHMFSGKALYTMACLSGKRLGVLVWKNDGVFWGYNRVFMFTTDAVDYFQSFANRGIEEYLNGYSWEDAYMITKQYGFELAKRLASEGKIIASVCMINNASSLVCYTKNMYPGETGCIFRKIAIKLLGRKLGWKLRIPFIHKKKN